MSRRRPSSHKLSSMDRRILNRLQNGIPLNSRPWARIADDLGVTEDFLLKRVGLLKKKGVVRRISAVFSPSRISRVSTLAAVKVAPARIEKTAKKINSYPEVTHNYKRDAEYNLWFAMVAKDKNRIAQIIDELGEDKDIIEISEFPTIKMFKINVNFAV